MDLDQNAIIEGNKLIAEFMGIVVTDFTWHELHTLAICDSDGKYDISDCDFYNPDSNWNALMEVVQKINSLGYFVNIYERHCKIAGKEKDCPIKLRFEAESRIESTYRAVLLFITRYNYSTKTLAGEELQINL